MVHLIVKRFVFHEKKHFKANWPRKGTLCIIDTSPIPGRSCLLTSIGFLNMIR